MKFTRAAERPEAHPRDPETGRFVRAWSDPEDEHEGSDRKRS